MTKHASCVAIDVQTSHLAALGLTFALWALLVVSAALI